MMGIKPRFADVELSENRNYLPTLKTINERFSPNTIAVVFIHLFGNPLVADALKRWSHQKHLLLIEDPTQALGGKYPSGGYLGSKGDVALYSFNKTKIIEAGNGVLIANTDEIAAELEQLLAEEKTPFPNVSEAKRSQIALDYRNTHHSLVSVIKANPANTPVVSQSFLKKRHDFDPLYLRPVNASIDLNAAWENLDKSLIHRRRMADKYADNIGKRKAINWGRGSGDEDFSFLNNFKLPPTNHGMTFLQGFKQSDVCWRFSFFIKNPEQQVPLSEAVRKDGFHVSNLYWPVNQFFNPSDECPNADWLARRIINLWVDTSVDEDYVERCAESVSRHAAELL
jgi:dTDP-4-amino-4,6-dideoxygalactose transaminase